MLLLVHTEVLLYSFDELNINHLYIITRVCVSEAFLVTPLRKKP